MDHKADPIDGVHRRIIPGDIRKETRPFIEPQLVKQGDATRITAGVFGEFSGCERTEQSRDIT